jgi:hypothetical protein
MLFPLGRQVLVGLYWRRDWIENISNEKRASIPVYRRRGPITPTNGIVLVSDEYLGSLCGP